MRKVTTGMTDKETLSDHTKEVTPAGVEMGVGSTTTPSSRLLVGLIFVDNNLLIKYCTGKVHQLFNLAEDEIYGTLNLFSHLINTPELVTYVKQSLTEQINTELILQSILPNNILIQIQPIKNNTIVDKGVILICYRLDKINKQDSEAIDPILLAIESATVGAFDWQIDKDLMVWNETIYDSFGISRGKFSGTYPEFLDIIYPDDRVIVKSAMKKALQQTDILDVWFRVEHPKRGLRYFYSHGVVYHDKNTGVRRVTSSCIDMTEQKQIETRLKLSEEKLGLVVDSSGIGIWDWSIEQDHMVWNNKMHDLLGTDNEKFTADFEALAKCIYNKDKKDFEKKILEAIRLDKILKLQVRVVHPEKGIRYVNILAKKHYDEDSKQKNMVGTCVDITEQKYAADQLTSIVESSPVAMILMNERGKVVFVNKHAELLFGYGGKELVNHSIDRLLPKGLRKHHIKERKVYSKNENPELISTVRELWIQHSNGSRIPVEMSSSTVMTHHGNLVMNVIKDITERKDAERVLVRTNQLLEKEVVDLKQTEEVLENLAHYDGLTQLPNRSYFHETLNRSLAQAKRGSHQLALLYIDLDNFKKANDNLGHSSGDGVLKLAAERLLEATRDSDFVARLGGDEFVILVDTIEDPYAVAKMARRLIKAFTESFIINNYEFKCTASIGISMYPTSGQTADELMQHADAAMYYAKDAGKSNYQFFSEKINQENQRRLTIENELLHALEREEMYLVYHPQFSLDTGKLFGVEVLLRWQNRKLGNISPLDFIEIAEETRMIEPIGEWVFKQACEQFQSWLQEYPALFTDTVISVNCAIQQLANTSFVHMIEKTLNKNNLNPASVLLEVTETGLMENISEVLKSLHMLHELGVGIAVDDFGKGYSSLSYLRQLPITVLKIDASFVQDIEDDTNAQAIIKAIIQLSQALQLDIIAEGVETKEQQDFLQAHHCQNVQGFLYTKPIKADELVNYLNNKKKS